MAEENVQEAGVDNMGEVIITSVVLRFGIAIVAVFMTWGLLRCLDLLNDFSFKTWIHSREPRISVAIYLAARIIAVSLLIGALFS